MTSCTKKKIWVQKTFPKGLQRKTNVATGLVAQRARNLPRKMHLNLSQKKKKKKALSLTSHPTLPSPTVVSLGSSWLCAASFTSSGARLFLSLSLPPGKALFCLHPTTGTSGFILWNHPYKEATFPVSFPHIYLSERQFLTAEQHAGWPGQMDLWMHAFGLHIATEMECGDMLCTSGWEMTKKSRSKGWYIIYISMLLFIKTLFSNKKNCFV